MLIVAVVLANAPLGAFAKGYSSGGHSYSSHSSSFSSHSSSFSSSRSSSSGFSSKSFSSGGGKSYSSGGNQRSSYSSGKSYSSGSDRSFFPSSTDRPRKSSFSNGSGSSSSSPGMTFDTSAARAAKESASKRDFNDYKQSQAARSSSGSSGRSSDYSGPVPPVIPRSQSAAGGGWNGGGYSRPYSHTSTVWYPDPYTYSTRSIRIHNYYAPYWSRPVVVYNDNYNSFFWWWLLDQSLEDRAYWAYHHRYDMDDARYRSLVYQDLALENRVAELEQRQVPRDPNYVPAGMDRDLMYTDNYVNRVYANRPTHTGQILFWFIMVPVAISAGGFFIWLIFYKRWQTSAA